MSEIFITGSSDGLGALAAKELISNGHKVLLHARNEKRAAETLKKINGAAGIITANLEVKEEVIGLASKVNAFGIFDVVIHNAGVYDASSKILFNVNTLAPYTLTCLINKPKRLIYLSSGMHKFGTAKLENFKNGNSISYSDTKLHVLMLCKAVANKWNDVYANTVNPGWVPTKMGGKGAPDDLQKGYETQVWLATSNDEQAKVSGQYFFHKQIVSSNPEANNISLQGRFLNLCEDITGVQLR
jgi:NAD(P)-dependent dehydrogenase (short-subunit alcohol dehydrogenase family)